MFRSGLRCVIARLPETSRSNMVNLGNRRSTFHDERSFGDLRSVFSEFFPGSLLLSVKCCKKIRTKSAKTIC